MTAPETSARTAPCRWGDDDGAPAPHRERAGAAELAELLRLDAGLERLRAARAGAPAPRTPAAHERATTDTTWRQR